MQMSNPRVPTKSLLLTLGIALPAVALYFVFFQPLDRPSNVPPAETPRITTHLRAAGSIHIPGIAPGPMTLKDGYVWIANQDGGNAAVWQVDSRTLERRRFSDVPANPVVDVVATHNHVWVVSNNGSAKAIHTQTGSILDRHLQSSRLRSGCRCLREQPLAPCFEKRPTLASYEIRRPDRTSAWKRG